MANGKGGGILEDVGRLLAPQTTQGFLNAPLERQTRERAIGQGNALDSLIQGLTGYQPEQTINVRGQDIKVPQLKLSTQAGGGPDGMSTVGDVNATSLGGGYAPNSGLGKFMATQAPMLAMRADPETALKTLQTNLIDAPTYEKLGPGDTLTKRTRSGGVEGLYTAPAKEPELSDDYRTALEMAGGDKAKAAQLFNTWKQKAGTTINMGGDKAITGVDAGRYKATVESLDTLSAMEPFLDQMMASMAAGAQTGFGQDQILALKQAYQTATGQELKGTSEQEVFQAASSYLGPRMRVAGSGSSSDRDTTLFLSSIPKLSRTPDGNRKIRDMYGRIKARKEAVAQIQQELLGQYERIPVTEERKRIDALGPLFTTEERKQLNDVGKQADRVNPSGTPSATGPNGKKIYLIDGKWQE